MTTICWVYVKKAGMDKMDRIHRCSCWFSGRLMILLPFGGKKAANDPSNMSGEPQIAWDVSQYCYLFKKNIYIVLR